MLESKRLPREMIFKRSRIEESRERQRISRECQRLARDVQGIERTMDGVRQKRNRAFQQAQNLAADAKRLGEKSLFRSKISWGLNVIGTVISGGSVTAAKQAIGNVISTIGSIVGFSSLEEQIIDKLEAARGKMDEFESHMGHLNHLEDGMDRINKTSKKLGCFC